MINKLIYIHEGIEKDAPKSTRHHLVNAHFFCGAYESKANSELWDEVYTYIDNNYDIKSIKRIYLGADGGGWIKAGGKKISGITYVMDEFQSVVDMLGYHASSDKEMKCVQEGADKMARLSAYTWNKRDMLELVRYQKTVMPKAAGAEEAEAVVAQVTLNYHLNKRYNMYGLNIWNDRREQSILSNPTVNLRRRSTE